MPLQTEAPPALFLPADPARGVVMGTDGQLWQVWTMPSGGEIRVPLGLSARGHNYLNLLPKPDIFRLEGGSVSLPPVSGPSSVEHALPIETESPIVEMEIFPYIEEETQ